jgi:ubiquinone/menaquinone biosynthesis C-methylase UbiE
MPDIIPKPRHLGTEYASQFADPAVVAVYHHRPPYPEPLFALLGDLVVGQPRTLLDIGCGTGAIARPMASIVDAVDAVDCSPPMLERGQSLPGGERSNLRWILGYVEDVPLPRTSYGLVTAAESLHWMDWGRLMPRLAELLAPGANLAIISRTLASPTPWVDDMQALIDRYSTNREYEPYNLIAELEKRALFEQCGVKQTEAVPFQQSFDSYIESVHSRNGFSRDRMTRQAAESFDAEVRDMLGTRCPDGQVEFDVVGRIIWGWPSR